MSNDSKMNERIAVTVCSGICLGESLIKGVLDMNGKEVLVGTISKEREKDKNKNLVGEDEPII